jgi:hypothetical protein
VIFCSAHGGCFDQRVRLRIAEARACTAHLKRALVEFFNYAGAMTTGQRHWTGEF